MVAQFQRSYLIILLGILGMGVLVFVPAMGPQVSASSLADSVSSAQPDTTDISLDQYAQTCAVEMGSLPSEIDCLANTSTIHTDEIPILVNGTPTTNIGTACDNPAQLSWNNIQRRCVPFSRLGVITTTKPGIITKFICRRYYNEDRQANEVRTEFHDVAVIMHNPANGNTCWFQSYNGAQGTPTTLNGKITNPMDACGTVAIG